MIDVTFIKQKHPTHSLQKHEASLQFLYIYTRQTEESSIWRINFS